MLVEDTLIVSRIESSLCISWSSWSTHPKYFIDILHGYIMSIPQVSPDLIELEGNIKFLRNLMQDQKEIYANG